MHRLGRLGAPAGLYVSGKVLGQEIQFLVDTGATVTCLSSDIWNQTADEQKPKLEEPNRKLMSVGGQALPVWGILTTEVDIEGHPITCQLQVVEIQEEAVLGLDLLSAFQLQWDWELGKLIWPGSHPSEELGSSAVGLGKDPEDSKSTSDWDQFECYADSETSELHDMSTDPGDIK